MNRRDLCTALLGLASGPFRGHGQAAATDDKAASLSLIRLIANPNAFDGRRVGVVGYLANNGLDRALGLYVSEVDGRNFIVANSIDLRIEESTVKNSIGKYVTLAGTYHAPQGTVSTYNGYLDHISAVKAWGYGDRT